MRRETQQAGSDLRIEQAFWHALGGLVNDFDVLSC